MCVNNSCGACSSCLETLVPIPLGPQGPAGAQGIQGEQGLPGDAGAPGAQGDQGLYGGFSMEFTFNDFTGFPVASTRLQINNSDWTLSNKLYVNHNDINTQDALPFLTSFTNDGNYGYLKVFKSDDSSIFLLGKVTNVFFGGSYSIIDFDYISSNGTPGVDIVNGEPVVLSFVGNGAAGIDSEVIKNDFDHESTTSASPSLLKQDTIPPGLLNIGDVYILEGFLAATNGAEVSFTLNGANVVTKVIKDTNAIKYSIELHVASATSFMIRYNLHYINGLNQVFFHEGNVGVGVLCNDINTLNNVINLLGASTSGAPMFSSHLVTYKFKK